MIHLELPSRSQGLADSDQPARPYARSRAPPIREVARDEPPSQIPRTFMQIPIHQIKTHIQKTVIPLGLNISSTNQLSEVYFATFFGQTSARRTLASGWTSKTSSGDSIPLVRQWHLLSPAKGVKTPGVQAMDKHQQDLIAMAFAIYNSEWPCTGSMLKVSLLGTIVAERVEHRP